MGLLTSPPHAPCRRRPLSPPALSRSPPLARPSANLRLAGSGHPGGGSGPRRRPTPPSAPGAARRQSPPPSLGLLRASAATPFPLPLPHGRRRWPAPPPTSALPDLDVQALPVAGRRLASSAYTPASFFGFSFFLSFFLLFFPLFCNVFTSSSFLSLCFFLHAAERVRCPSTLYTIQHGDGSL